MSKSVVSDHISDLMHELYENEKRQLEKKDEKELTTSLDNNKRIKLMEDVKEMDYYIEPKILNNLIVIHPATNQRIHMDRGSLYRRSKFFQEVMNADPNIKEYIFNIDCTYSDMKEFLIIIDSFKYSTSPSLSIMLSTNIFLLCSMLNQYECTSILTSIYELIVLLFASEKNCYTRLRAIIELDKYRLNDVFKIKEIMIKHNMYECLCKFCIEVINSYPNAASIMFKLRSSVFMNRRLKELGRENVGYTL